MRKDPVLAEGFFSLGSAANELANHDQQTLDHLIETKLYPHLDAGQAPRYYEGVHKLAEIMAYRQTAEYSLLQNELSITVERIKQWGETQAIEEIDSLTIFKQKLTVPSDQSAVLYAYGKKYLEKIAVLIEEPEIELDLRKKIITDFLADRELTKCINGCFSRIASTATQLEENLVDRLQIQRWIRSYTNEMSRQVATQRPFAIPISYQELVCKAADCSIQYNMLHANNYLVQQAKTNGFPIDIPIDQGAVELGRGLSEQQQRAIVTPYLRQLEKSITATKLVDYLSEKLHDNFQSVLAEDINYADKTDLMLNKLNLLGDDPWFSDNKVGLSEIIADDGSLKNAEFFRITVAERLLSRGLIKGAQLQTLPVLSGELNYRHFFSTPELTWFWIDNARVAYLDLIKQNRLSELRGFEVNARNRHTILQAIFPSDRLIKKTEDLLFLLKNHALDQRLFLHWVTMERGVALIKASNSAKLFMELLNDIPQPRQKTLFLQACGDEFVANMVQAGIHKADFYNRFPALPRAYTGEYDFNVKQEALSITKGLIKLLIEHGFKNFQEINFYDLKQLNYLEAIDFSKTQLQRANFFLAIKYVRFDEAELSDVKFWQELDNVSFKKTDLKQVSFLQLAGSEYSAINLDGALLSSSSFKQLRGAGIENFSKSNLQAVDFQQSDIKRRLQGLDFSQADLTGVNLGRLDLRYTLLYEANLAQVNLLETDLSDSFLNEKTKLAASQMGLSSLISAYQQGVKVFDQCIITMDIDFTDNAETVIFKRVSFKGAQFFGLGFIGAFNRCDLSGASFSPSPNPSSSSAVLELAIRTRETQLTNSQFRQVKFLTSSRILDATLDNMVLDQVAMNTKLLFSLYVQGLRNFKGVKDLQGAIASKLLPFPVLEAELNEKIFIHLYRQGLRDFRGSNLNSFYLGKLLTEQAISEIDLKLEGAVYQSSPLGCGLVHRSKRARTSSSTVSACGAYFLLQGRSVDERVLSRDDIESLAQSSQKPFVLRERVLAAKSIYLLDQVQEAHFYFAYRIDEVELLKSLDFIRDSTPQHTRHTMRLQFYMYQRFDEHAARIYIRSLSDSGFVDIRVNAYHQQTQFILQLKNNFITQETKLAHLTPRFIQMLNNIKTTPKISTKNFNEETYRHRLRRIGSSIRRKSSQGLQAGGRRGAQYEIGAGLMHVIHQWLINRSPEPKALDAETKAAFKVLAHNVSVTVGKERGASEHQIELAWNVTQQCINRGECSTEALVISDVVDSMHRMRPDLMIGNEYGWKKLKELFTDFATYISDRFDDVKNIFHQNSTLSSNTLHSLRASFNAPHPVRPSFNAAYPLRPVLITESMVKKQKRTIVNWYESPLLIRFIKAIEECFAVFDDDLQLNEVFSEGDLAVVLYDLWQALAEHGISKCSSPESILRLLRNNSFIQQVLNSSQIDSFADPFIAFELSYVPLSVNASQRVNTLFYPESSERVDEEDASVEDSHELDSRILNATLATNCSATQNMTLTEIEPMRSSQRGYSRQKRSLKLKAESSREIEDRLWDEANDYLAQYEKTMTQRVSYPKNKSISQHLLAASGQSSSQLNKPIAMTSNAIQQPRYKNTTRQQYTAPVARFSKKINPNRFFKPIYSQQSMPVALNKSAKQAINNRMGKTHFVEIARMHKPIGMHQVESKQARKYLNQQQVGYERLGNSYSHYSAQSGISQVTVKPDWSNTLIALDVGIRYITKNSYRAMPHAKVIRQYEKAERQIKNIFPSHKQSIRV